MSPAARKAPKKPAKKQPATRAKQTKAEQRAAYRAKRSKPKAKGRPPKLREVAGTRQVEDAKGQKRTVEVTVWERLIEAARAGTPHDQAARYAGVSRSALLGWLQRARDALALAEEQTEPDQDPRDLVPAPDRLYVDFLDAYEKARSDAVVGSLAVIHGAARGGTWQAAAWFLERSFPGEFGQRSRMDLGAQGKDGERVSLADLFRETREDA